jgi:hypothetical protein
VTVRDTGRERQFLRAAARGSEAFVHGCEQRLEAGQALYGDTWAHAGVMALLGEIVDETLDVACWSVLAAQTLDQDEGLSGLRREQLRAVLEGAARRGAQAFDLLDQARRSLEVAA